MSTTSELEATAPKVSLEQEDGLCFHHNIPRGMVHRAAISEVFLTDSHRTPTGVAVAAQLPRNHAYFSDHRGTATNYDSLLLVEVFRQVAIYYAHEYRGVSTDRKFVFSAAEYGILEPASLRIGSAPGHCVIMAEPVQEKTRGDELVGLTLQMTAFVDGVEAARETMQYQWMPKDAWAKVRSRTRTALGLPETYALPAPSLRARLRPEAVGRTNPRNSILAEPAYDERGRFVALALVDTDHPSLFDHALDHVPGMLQCLHRSRTTTRLVSLTTPVTLTMPVPMPRPTALPPVTTTGAARSRTPTRPGRPRPQPTALTVPSRA